MNFTMTYGSTNINLLDIYIFLPIQTASHPIKPHSSKRVLANLTTYYWRSADQVQSTYSLTIYFFTLLPMMLLFQRSKRLVGKKLKMHLTLYWQSS